MKPARKVDNTMEIPMADNDGSGWTIFPGLLGAIVRRLQMRGKGASRNMSMEEVEQVLLVLIEMGEQK